METLKKYLLKEEEKAIIKKNIIEFLHKRYNRKSDFNKFIQKEKIVLFQSIKIEDQNTKEIGIMCFGLQFANQSEEINKMKLLINELEIIANHEDEKVKLDLALTYGRKLLDEKKHRMIGPLWFNEKKDKNISFLNKENNSLVYFLNEIDLIKNEEGVIFSTKMVSLDDIINSKMFVEKRENVGFEKENTIEQEILIEMMVEKTDVKYDTRLVGQEYYIRKFIQESLVEKNIKIPFSLCVLNDNTIENERDGSASGLLYLHNKLIGVANNYNRRYEQDFSWYVFKEFKNEFESVLNDIIKQSSVEEFIEELKNKSEDRVDQGHYVSIEKFNENPLEFIEQHSYYVFNGKEL